MLPLLLAAISIAATPPENLIPARWPSSDAGTLAVLRESPINCLLVPEAHWSNEFLKAAHARNLTVLGLIAPGSAALPRARRATDLGLDGVVLEGAFAQPEVQAVRSELTKLTKLTVELGLRGLIPLDAHAPAIIGTHQGVWAGINSHEDGEVKAAPSGAPWIDTNAGFLRFVRANTTRPFWLAAKPPPKTIVSLSRYLQMIADTAMVGARWVIHFEDANFARLTSGDAKAISDFKRINQVLEFFEHHRDIQRLPPWGQLAVVEDVQNGALLSGSVLDMITVKHTPVVPVPFKALAPVAFGNVKMAVNVDPQSLDAGQLKVLRDFTRGGGTVLTAPPGWRMPVPRADQMSTDAENVKKLDQIWKEVNSMTGRRNLGARLFNVSSMLSNMVGSSDGKKVCVFLVNYSDFPIDSIAIHLLGKFSKATLYWPERPPKVLTLYENEDGSGADIDILESSALLIAEN